METKDFTNKLLELKDSYTLLLEYMNINFTNHNLQSCIEDIKISLKNDEEKMRLWAEGSKLPLVSKFANAQAEYYNTMDKMFSDEIDKCRSAPENSTELSALYSEFIFDCAIFSTKKAVYALLKTAAFDMKNKNTH